MKTIESLSKPAQRLALIANLLEYPEDNYKDYAQDLGKLETKLETFHDAIKDLGIKELDELYTSTFDLQMISYPYIGYHLFGESFKRGAFLAGLIDRYKIFGFDFLDKQADHPNLSELPDHMAIILKFLVHLSALDSLEAKQERKTLISDALIPGLGAILANFGFEDEVILPQSTGIDPLHSRPGEVQDAGCDGCAPEEEQYKSKEIEKWEEEREKEKSKGTYRSNPYVKVLRTLLNILEQEEETLKGEINYV